MDIATILGITVAILFSIYSIMSGGGSIGTFIQGASLAITVGGAVGSTIINFTLPQIKESLKCIPIAFKSDNYDLQQLIEDLVRFAEKSRREGLLTLEKEAKNISDPFIQKGLRLVIDGTEQETIRTMLEIEAAWIEERHAIPVKFWEKLAELFPAWGMIGTLIGLVLMFQNMTDPSKIGGAMAISLLTTFYGSFLANFWCIPFSGKLKIKHAEEMMLKTIVIEGILAVQAGDNPRIVREKLSVFLSPALRKAGKD